MTNTPREYGLLDIYLADGVTTTEKAVIGAYLMDRIETATNTNGIFTTEYWGRWLERDRTSRDDYNALRYQLLAQNPQDQYVSPQRYAELLVEGSGEEVYSGDTPDFPSSLIAVGVRTVRHRDESLFPALTHREFIFREKEGYINETTQQKAQWIKITHDWVIAELRGCTLHEVQQESLHPLKRTQP